MKITTEWLKEKRACRDGIAWYIKSGCEDPSELLDKIIENDRLDWAEWLVSHMVTHKQAVSWAVECAESVLPIFEAKHTGDDRPRKAIQAAKDWIAGKITATQARAAAAAADAADAAYAAYAAYAADADAADAAYAAYAAAAADAAYAYAYAYAADAAYAAARREHRIKNLKRGLEIAMTKEQPNE